MSFALTLRAYRETLGLAQYEAARLVDVRQATWSRWEQGVREPRDPDNVIEEMRVLASFHNDIFDAMCAFVKAQDAPRVELGTYISDEAFWRNNEQAQAKMLPASLHRSAAAQCAYFSAAQTGQVVEIVDAEA